MFAQKKNDDDQILYLIDCLPTSLQESFQLSSRSGLGVNLSLFSGLCMSWPLQNRKSHAAPCNCFHCCSLGWVWWKCVFILHSGELLLWLTWQADFSDGGLICGRRLSAGKERNNSASIKTRSADVQQRILLFFHCVSTFQPVLPEN